MVQMTKADLGMDDWTCWKYLFEKELVSINELCAYYDKVTS